MRRLGRWQAVPQCPAVPSRQSLGSTAEEQCAGLRGLHLFVVRLSGQGPCCLSCLGAGCISACAAELGSAWLLESCTETLWCSNEVNFWKLIAVPKAAEVIPTQCTHYLVMEMPGPARLGNGNAASNDVIDRSCLLHSSTQIHAIWCRWTKHPRPALGIWVQLTLRARTFECLQHDRGLGSTLNPKAPTLSACSMIEPSRRHDGHLTCPRDHRLWSCVQ